MDNSAMKLYLEEYRSDFKYTYVEDEPLKNYFKYWKKFWVDNCRGTEIDKIWVKKNGINIKFPNADTIVSLWTPLSYCMKKLGVSKILGFEIFKCSSEFYEAILQDDIYNRCFPKDNLLVQKLNILAELASTNYNVMSIPQGRFNSDRYSCSNDQIALTLHHCFKGRLNRYFSNEEEIIEWIRNQDLQICFDGEIKYENIIGLDKYKENNFKPIWPEITDDLEVYIEMVNDYIEFFARKVKINQQECSR